MARSLPNLALCVVFATVAAGCHCGGTQTDRVYAEVELVYPGADGSDLASRDQAVYDFGPVFMGEQVDSKVRVHNAGSAVLTLSSAEVTGGDATGLDATLAEKNVFNLQFKAGTKVDPGGVAEFPLNFRPPNGAPGVEVEDHQATIVLHTEGTRSADALATMTLKGKGVSGVCDMDRVLDFGAVQKSSTGHRYLRLRNPSQINATVTLGDPYSTTGDDKAFVFSAGMPHGSVVLPPQSEQDLYIDFTPTTVKPYVAFLKVRASEACPEVVLSLEGQGVDSVLTWTPQMVDCAFSPVGFQVSRPVTFTNLGLDPVDVGDFQSDEPDFYIVPDAVFDGSKATVPGKGSATVQVGCKPTQLGARSTLMRFQTTLQGQPTGEISVKVLGGGPDIDVKPPLVAFGQVAYFQGATPPSFQTRRVVVSNVGTRPAANDDSANLKLGVLDGVGDRVAPFATIVPANSNTAQDEFTVTISPNYDPSKGVGAIVGSNSTDLTVKFVPKTLGAKAATLTIPSNDPDEPVITLNVTADAEVMPPCSYSLTPANLNFGVVTPPGYRDLPFTITNTGPNDCLLSDLDFASDTNQAYTLPAGPVANKTLAPNESMTVTVRSWPQIAPPTGGATLTGQLQFFMSSPTNPQALVPLKTTLVSPCLTIAPNDLDFGTVAMGCSSPSRTFTVYNTCPSAVTVNQIRVQVGAGLPPGTGSCPANGPWCNEFSVTGSSVTLPYGFQPGSAPISFTARYAPIDTGLDYGAIALDALQNGQPVTYLVTLTGTGDANGENTDTFVQDANPKADILLTIDNSCSMAPYQNSLATNFAAFMAYANSVGVDYHMAVTTTDDSPGGEQGKMVYGPNDPDVVLTPSSTNVTSQFAAKVNVGVNGSGTETGLSPSLKALTAPLIATNNAGFLRQDANLGVVVVTDAPDQSGGTAAYYIASFINIKGQRHANQFSFSAVAGFNPNPPSGCSYDTSPDDGKYAAVVAGTKGVKEEICTQNWSQTLQNLGKTLFGYRTSFFLTAVPDLTGGKTIDVKIDGTAVPQTDTSGATAWSYDATSNSVDFQPAYVPEPGQTLTIHYFVTCTP